MKSKCMPISLSFQQPIDQEIVIEASPILMATSQKDDDIPNGQCNDAMTPCIDTSLSEESVEDDSEVSIPLVYKISDKPPIHLVLFFGIQV